MREIQVWFSFSIALIGMLLEVPFGYAAEDAAAGWNLLWGNQTGPARAIFEERLTASPGDADAGRGRILALAAQGHEHAALAEMLLQCRREGVDARDFLLATWLENQIATSGADQKTLQAIFQYLGEAGNLDPLDRRAVRAAAIDRAIANGNSGEAEKLAKSLNRPDRYWLLGPFANLSGSGYRKDLLGGMPLTPETDYPGRNRLKVRWFPCPVLDLARQVNAYNHFPGRRDLCAFVGTAFQVSEPVTGLLSITRQGSLSLRLDGTPLVDHEDPAEQSELEHFEVDLPAGRHTLIARVCGQSGDATLAIGLSDRNGDPLGRLQWVPLFPDGLAGGDVTFRPRRLPMIQTFEEAAHADTASASRAFWYLQALNVMDCRDDLRATATEALSRFPHSSLLVLSAAQALARLGEEDSFQSRLERARHLDNANVLIQVEEAAQAIETRRYGHADSLLSAVTSTAPDCIRARFLELASFTGRSLDREATDLAQKLVMEFPDFSYPYDALADHEELFGRASDARKLRRQALDRLPRTAGVIMRLASAFQSDRIDDQIRWLTPLARIYRDSPTIQINLAVARFRSGRMDALDLVNDAIKAFPYSADAYFLKGLLVEAGYHIGMTVDKPAVHYFARAAELSPGNLVLRDRLRFMSGKKSVREIVPPVNFETKRRIPVDSGLTAGQPAVVLLDDVKRIVLEDGTSFDERNLSIKVLNADGVLAFGSLPLKYNSYVSDQVVTVARTVKPDGTSIDAEQRPDEVAFKALAPGDIIELSFGANAWGGSGLDDEFWDSHLFQRAHPCVESRYTLLMPPGRNVEIRLNHPRADVKVDSTETMQEGFRQIAWVARNVPGRSTELLAPPPRDAAPWLDVSTVSSWDRIVRWYLELSDLPSRNDPIVAARARELTRADATAEEKARTLYAFVNSSVAYENLDFQYSAFIPEPAPAVLRALYGDCKDQVCLLKSMLAAVDVPAAFALVSPNHGGVTPFLPSPRFTHAILALDLAGRRLFLDPTARGTPFGAVPGLLEGAPALVIGGESPDLVGIEPSPAYTSNHFHTRVDLGEAREISVTRTECYHRADDIARLRSDLALLTNEERSQIVATRLGAHLGRIHMTRCDWSGLEVPGDSVTVSYALTAEEPSTPAGNLRILRLPWSTMVSSVLGSLVAAETRVEPLDLSAARVDETEDLLVTIPAGWTVTGVPDPVEVSGAAGEMTVRFLLEGSTLRGTRHLRLTGRQIPASDYAPTREFLAAVNKARETSVVLQQVSR